MSARCCTSSRPPPRRAHSSSEVRARPSGSPSARTCSRPRRRDDQRGARGVRAALIDAAVGRAGEGAGIVDAALVERAIARRRSAAHGEQAAAVRAIVEPGDGVTVIQALAGTGKTYTAGVLREVYEQAGYRGDRRRADRAARHASSPSRPASRRARLTACCSTLTSCGDELPDGMRADPRRGGDGARRARARDCSRPRSRRARR